ELFARLLDVRRPLPRAVQLQRVDVKGLRSAHQGVDAEDRRVRVLQKAPQPPAAIAKHQLQLVAVLRKLFARSPRANALRPFFSERARLFSGRRRDFSCNRGWLAPHCLTSSSLGD